MVFKGQFLERPTLIPVGSEVLEGLAHRGTLRPPLLILSPRPLDGGGMDHVVAAELAFAGANAGFPTLRFNFRGVGASQGERSGNLEALVADAEAAISLLLENTGARALAVAAIAGSAEVALALEQAFPSVGGVALIGPPTLAPEVLAARRGRTLVVVGEHDLRQPRATLGAALAAGGGQLELVERADAQFTRGLPQVGKAVVHWLRLLGGVGVTARHLSTPAGDGAGRAGRR